MIYELIKQRRIKLGYTQAKMAKLTGIKQQNYQLMESGASDIQVSNFLKILSALKIDNSQIEKLLCQNLPEEK